MENGKMIYISSEITISEEHKNTYKEQTVFDNREDALEDFRSKIQSMLDRLEDDDVFEYSMFKEIKDSAVFNIEYSDHRKLLFIYSVDPIWIYG